MPKQKSSASSATRKKHARKAAGVGGEPLPPTNEKKAKGSKKDKHAPKVKQYIPPTKPAPLRPDPLDVGGLAARIDPDLLVVLRRLGKKDAVTKRRALEELTQLATSNPDRLVEAAPVWTHHFPSLALHPARRVRALTASTHAALLPILLSENAPIDMVPLLGPWCMLAHDMDRAVAMAARPTWDAHGTTLVARGDYERETLDEFASRAAMDPAALNAELNPAPPPAPTPAKRGLASSSTPEPRDKAEGDEEATTDRAARLRVGALGALGWLVSNTIERPSVLHASELWTSLSTEKGAFGQDQPGVRRAAWSLVGLLAPRGLEGDELAAVASAVLRSAWVEPDAVVRAAMWEPLLVFLTKYPSAWHLERQQEHEHEHDEDSDSDVEDHEHHDTSISQESGAYAEFLQFLALGCGGSPARGFPTVLVILSTVPPDIIGNGESFFTALWGAVDGRALATPDASRAFLSAFVECVLFFASRKYGGDPPAQLARAWEAMLKKELRNVSAVPLTEALGKLGRMDSAAFETAWNSIARITEAELGSDDVDRAHVLSLLKDLRARPELGALLAGFATTAIRTRKDIILEGLLEAFGEELMANDAVRSDLNGLVAQTEPPPSIGLLLAYVARHLDEKLWNTILSRVDTSTLPQLLAFQAAHPAVNSLRPLGTELDALFQSMLDAVLSGTSSPDVAAQLLAKPEPFISPAALAAAEERIASCVSLTTDAVLRDPSVDVTPARSAIALLHARAWSGVRPKAFVLARLVPNSLPNVVIALHGEEERDAVLHTLHDLLLDTSVLATPVQILDTALRTTAGSQRVMNLLFPPASELERMRVEAARVPYPPSYGVVEPLAASSSTSAASSVAKKSVDLHGKTAYTRVLEALVPFLCTERSLARENPWIIAHVALLPSTPDVDTLAAYLLAPPDDGWHIRVADAITKPAGSLNDALADVLVHIVRNCATPREAVGLGKLLKRLLNGAEVNEAEAWTRAARSLERSTPLASHAILRTISSTALEPPLLARYRTELAATLAGVPPAKCNTEGLRLLRALNAAAPDASGDAALVPQQRAVFLMKTIERWIEDADEIDEEVESGMTELFVSLAPVLQSVPGKHWDTVLDLIENGLESTNMGEEDELLSLARTLRLLGSVIELAASTKMLRQEYWAPREKKIMALVLRLLEAQGSGDKDSAARAACKELLISLAAHIPSASLDPDTLSKTVHLLASNNAAVLQAAYPFLQQAAAKRTEYLVIESAASTLTVEATAAEDGVRTPAFDEPAAPKIELPVELLALVQLQLEVELDDEADGELLSAWQSLLFAWMLIFDCFVDASAKVKAGFVEQLRDLDLVELYFAPNVLGLLGVMHSGGGGSSTRKSFKLDVWAIEEFFLSLYDPRTTLSPRLLSAHLFFRALESTPTLIRGWFLKSKDRQLHTAVSAYISSYFSPPLIATALQPLRALPSDSELKADGWALRVGGGGSEALLSYTVDEQSLEVALRLPPEWPLKGAEVREVRKVGGIPENRWRAWTFGLAQNAAGDGGVLEGLRNFRKNVAGHFEGQVECAICYCIISVTDQSLPTKPCRTCKNRFHASCLYKWFKSSHASTCPLCRSDIL